jgi:hypothetical protein
MQRCFKLVSREGKDFWECLHCTVYSPGGIKRFAAEDVKASSGNAWKHIRQRHPVHHPKRAATDERETEQSSDIISELSSIASPSSASSHAGVKRAASPSLVSQASKRSTVSKQTTLFAQRASTESLTQHMALAFACSHLPFQLADRPAFRDFLLLVRNSVAAIPTRRTVQAATLSAAAALRRQLIQRLRDTKAPVAIAFDGWTNTNSQKVTNIVLVSRGIAFYWCSIVNRVEKNTASWLHSKLVPVLQELMKEGVPFAGFIGDNEAVNGALHRRLLVEFPFLLRIPCSAHTIQLIVGDILRCERWAGVKASVEEVLKHFSSTKESRSRLLSLQEANKVSPLCLIKPTETRWNSFLYASQRMLKLKDFIDLIVKQDARVWQELDRLVALLLPFQKATDILQRDASTLFDVFSQWNELNKHLLEEEDIEVKNGGLKSLRDRWHANVNVAATNATALLSFITLPEESDEQRAVIQQAKEEIASFGSKYLRAFQQSPRVSEQELHDRLLLQFGAFRTRTPPFSMLDRDIRLAQNPIQVWGMHFETELAKIAIVLLQTPSSEASVERTFSAQDSIHRKKRNRLHSDSVEASMFIAFNHPLLMKPISEAPPAVRVIELSIDFQDPQTDDDSEVEVDEVSMDDEEEDVEMEDASLFSEDAESDADAASVTAPQRVATGVFLDDFIRENQLNVKSRFTCDLEARLTEEAREKNAGGKSTKALLKAIRDKLKSAAAAAAADAPAAAAAE